MTKEEQAISLLPYLSAVDSKIILQIRQKASGLDKSYFYPFFVLNEFDIFSRLLPASFVTQSGDKIKNIFLLLQKDDTPSSQVNFPLDNQKISKLWQEIGKVYSQDNQKLNLTEHDQEDSGHPTLFAPLLFCRKKNTFFHPPCPNCGGRLEQCLDDKLLQETGLEPYTTTFKRYLFCSSCFVPADQNNFFVRDHEESDPDFVLDCHSLYKLIGKLINGNKSLPELPCSNCSMKQQCFESGGLVQDRIIPFSFYNFYMLTSAELPLQALDFLAVRADKLLSAQTRKKTKLNQSRKETLSTITAQEPAEDDKIIYKILKDIKTHWQTGKSNQQQPVIPTEESAHSFSDKGEPEDDMEKTMIINTAELFPEAATTLEPSATTPPQAPATGHEPEDDMEKTMIINTADVFRKTATPPSQSSEETETVEDIDAEETVILSAEKIAQLTNKRRDG